MVKLNMVPSSASSSLTVEDAEELSIKSLRNFNGSVLIIYGSMDTPNFIRQNNELVEVLRHSGLNVTLKVIKAVF